MLIRSIFKRVNFVCSHFTNTSILSKRFKMNGDKDKGIFLKTITDKLFEFAPTSMAESWDNVGILVEPSNECLVSNILLTNDLTEDVMDEALEISANLIISYHPPIFTSLKRITNSNWKERIIARCIVNNIAIFSPHTSWDVVQGGVNDWLANAFEYEEVKPLTIQKSNAIKSKYTLTVESTDDNLFIKIGETYARSFLEMDLKILMVEKSTSTSMSTKFTVEGTEEILKKIVPMLQQNVSVLCYYINPQYTIGDEVSGVGRICKLKTPITIMEAVKKLKKYIGISFVQLALARKVTPDHLIKTIAFVAGSGGSLLKNTYCDLKITGEASHHDILDSIHNGSSVILTNHSNSERGFLLEFKKILTSKLNNPNVQIIVSSTDSDPLKIL